MSTLYQSSVSADSLGMAGLMVGACVTVMLARRYRTIATPLYWAFALRAICALVHYYVISIPPGMGDAFRFEQTAWEWSQQSFGEILSTFNLSKSYNYTTLLALLYSLLDRSPLMAQSINVMIGTLVTVNTYLLGSRVWNVQQGRRAAWIFALFPDWIMYSSVTLREEPLIYAFSLGLLATVNWRKHGSTIQLVMAIGFFAIAACFHGGMFTAILGLGAVAVLDGFRGIVGVFQRANMQRRVIVGLVAVLILGYVMVNVSDLEFSKIGSLQSLAQFDPVEDRLEQEDASGGAAYPAFVTNFSPLTQPYMVPLRVAYFLFSPFPWDVRQPQHLLGLFDSFFYFLFIRNIWRSRRELRSNQVAKALLIILVPLILTYAFGTQNFGTGLRHRGKFGFMLAALATGPFFGRLRRRIRPVVIRE